MLTAHQTVARDGYSRQTLGLNDNELTHRFRALPAEAFNSPQPTTHEHGKRALNRLRDNRSGD